MRDGADHLRLNALGIPLPKDGKAIEDYGNRIFRNPGFIRSLTEQEKKLRDLPAEPARRAPIRESVSCRLFPPHRAMPIRHALPPHVRLAA